MKIDWESLKGFICKLLMVYGVHILASILERAWRVRPELFALETCWDALLGIVRNAFGILAAFSVWHHLIVFVLLLILYAFTKDG